LNAICVLTLFGLGVPVGVRAQVATPDKAAKAYAQSVARAQADLDGGRIAEARQQLEASSESVRSFEYDYLLARAKAAKPDRAAPHLIKTITKPDVETRYGVLNEVNRLLVFICRDGTLRVVDLTSTAAAPRVLLETTGNAVWSGVFSHDGSTFASGHQNGAVLVWDVKTWKVRQRVPLGQEWPVRELALAPDGGSFVAESKEALELWTLRDAKPKKVAAVGERYNFGEGLAFSPQGDMIATGGMFDILLHKATTGEQTAAMRHASYTMGLEFSPDGKRIASAPRGNVNKFLAVFDVGTGKSLFNAGPFDNYIAGMAFTADAKRIAATGCEKLLRLFDAATGELVMALPRPECGAKPAFTRDGRLLGWSEPDGYKVIDLSENKLVP
jgi:WD40 repeat protein